MHLWTTWWTLVLDLRPAFHRTRTFLWSALALGAICTRIDLRGVTSLVRALGLRQDCYDRLLDFFHTTSVNLGELTQRWVSLVLRTLKPFLFTVNGRIVLQPPVPEQYAHRCAQSPASSYRPHTAGST